MFRTKLAHLIVAVSVLLTAGLAIAPAAALAASDQSSGDFKGDACSGINALNDSTSTTCPSGGESSIQHMLTLTINIMSVIIGAAAIIMIIVGGLKIITSNGDSSNVASGRSTIMYALIGLVIAVAAQLLVHFVLKQSINAVK